MKLIYCTHCKKETEHTDNGVCIKCKTINNTQAYIDKIIELEAQLFKFDFVVGELLLPPGYYKQAKN